MLIFYADGLIVDHPYQRGLYRRINNSYVYTSHGVRSNINTTIKIILKRFL
jgi:hypothetical protein